MPPRQPFRWAGFNTSVSAVIEVITISPEAGYPILRVSQRLPLAGEGVDVSGHLRFTRVREHFCYVTAENVGNTQLFVRGRHHPSADDFAQTVFRNAGFGGNATLSLAGGP